MPSKEIEKKSDNHPEVIPSPSLEHTTTVEVPVPPPSKRPKPATPMEPRTSGRARIAPVKFKDYVRH